MERTIGPAVTNVIGIVISAIIAFNLGAIAARFYDVLLLPVALFAFGLVFRAGQQDRISIGWVGVPTFIDRRIRGPVLSEGRHWLLPFIMGFEPVDAKIEVYEQIVDPKDHSKLDETLSQDTILMRARFLFKFQVVDPWAWLNVNNQIAGLAEIAQNILRDAIAKQKSTDLITDSAKSQIGRDITIALDEEAAHFGIDIIEASVPTMRLPKAVEEAYEKKAIETAEREAEEIEIDNIIKRTGQLKELGFNPTQAAEILQIERKKVVATRHIVRVEDAETISKAIATAITAVFGKGG